MNEARVERLGLDPLKEHLAAIDALTEGKAVAEHLRQLAAQGQNPLFDFGPEADFKSSAMNLAYAHAAMKDRVEKLDWMSEATQQKALAKWASFMDHFRAGGAASNMPAFAAAFGCKPGDAMVRSGDAQIAIW